MFRNYLITASRYMIKNGLQSVIQILSLAIGITTAILLGLYVRYEVSYDRFNERYDRIYRLEFADHVGLPAAPGHQIKQEIPDVKNVVRMLNWHGKDHAMPVSYWSPNDSVQESYVRIQDYFWCDSTIFDIFSFKFIQGDPKTALKVPGSVVLTKNTAKKMFGDHNPMGESLYGNSLTVTGVIEDYKHSHLEINMLISITSIRDLHGKTYGEPGYLNNYFPDYSYITYVLLRKGSDPSFVEKSINDHFSENVQSDDFVISGEKKFRLRPLGDVYFTTGLKGEHNYCKHGNLNLMRMLLTIAAFILFLAIINYINLTTARASLRAREVGIRKVMGVTRSKLILQFIVEAVLLTFISLLIALTMVQLLLPQFNEMASTHFDLKYIAAPATIGVYILAAIIVGFLAGLYPAVYYTRFKPMSAIYGEKVKGSGSGVFRRILLTFQFTISIALIIGVLVIFSQLRYSKSADLGFNMKDIVNNEFSIFGDHPMVRRYFKEQLMQNPDIKGVAFSMETMGGNQAELIQPVEVKGVKRQVSILGVDPDFFDVMGIEMTAGRNFSWNRPGDMISDTNNRVAKYIVNETAVREFGIESPIGYTDRREGGQPYEIIGVVKDFNFASLHEKIEPYIYFWGGWMPTSSIRIASHDVDSTMAFLKEKITSIFRGVDDVWFDFSFLEDTFNKQYQGDERTARIIVTFAVIAILIACLGLYGLSSFMAARRIKEIGIRKVLGASSESIFVLLARVFVIWVGISILIACPVGWYVMNGWLRNFAYRTSIGAWIFLVAIFSALIVTILTVTWQSLKSARTNPVEALRYE